MASTAYKERGSRQLSDKQRLFVDYYLIDLDATKAAIKCGYKPSGASVQGNKLLNNPAVAAEIGKQCRLIHENLELTQEEILKQLYYVTTRDIREYVDSDGIMLPLNKLSDRAALAVDGFDQEITDYYDADGNCTRTTKNKLKLVSKATAIDMAMRYRGLFAPTETKNENTTTVQFDYNKLFMPPDMSDDPVEAAMKALEDKSTKPIVIEASKAETEPTKKTTKKAKT